MSFSCTLYPGLRYGPHPRQNADLYLPTAGGGRPPLLLLIHGGGWNALGRGPLGSEAYLVARGVAVARMEYRYSTQAPHPAQLEDCRACLKLLREQAPALGLDADACFSMGHSAGGHLASLLACTTPGLRGCIATASPTDLGEMARTPLPTGGSDEAKLSMIGQLLGCDPLAHPQAALAASPIAHVGPDTPPHLLVHSDGDVVVPASEGVRFQQRMRAAGRPCELRLLRGVDHIGEPFFDDAMLASVHAFICAHRSGK